MNVKKFIIVKINSGNFLICLSEFDVIGDVLSGEKNKLIIPDKTEAYDAIEVANV